MIKVMFYETTVMDVMSVVNVLIMLYMQMTLCYWLLHLQHYKSLYTLAVIILHPKDKLLVRYVNVWLYALSLLRIFAFQSFL